MTQTFGFTGAGLGWRKSSGISAPLASATTGAPASSFAELLYTSDGPSYFFFPVGAFFFISASSVSNRSRSSKFQYSVIFASSSNSSCVNCLYSTFTRSGAGFASLSLRIFSLRSKIACAVARFDVLGS